MEFLTVQEAARKIGVGETAIRNAIRRERLSSQRMYGRIVVAQNDLEAYETRAHPDGVKPRGRPKVLQIGS